MISLSYLTLLLVIKLLTYYWPYFIYINFNILTKLILLLSFSYYLKYLRAKNLIYIL